MFVVVRSGVLKTGDWNGGAVPEMVVGRCGVAEACTSGRNGVLVGGNIEVLGRLGDSVSSSPNIAMTRCLAA